MNPYSNFGGNYGVTHLMFAASVCSPFSQPDGGACKMDEREERLGEFVVARGEAYEMFETSEKAFAQIAIPIEFMIERP